MGDRGAAREEGGRVSGDESFGRFVAEQRAGLLRTALLLTGDRGAAEELVQTALTRVWWRWRRLSDPAAAVRREVVRGVTGWRARLLRGEQVVEELPDPFAPPPAGASPALAGALRELPPRTRAAAVLRWYAQCSEEETAQALGCPVATARTEAARGREALLAIGVDR
jgi:DNA-directed RNA polymerase specialized sigma24 family protein